MAITFRKAIREDVSLLIGLAGGTGSGKSFSGMRLASGMSNGKPFAVIDSENRRALHYADQFKFDHAELRAPFRPQTYADAIKAADDAGYSVIVVDQMSFEHVGEGGLLDWQEEELTRMAGDDYKKREACKMASWIRPKASHKAMMQTLLQVRAHLILLFRAEQKIEMVKDDHGKWIVQPKKSPVGADGWLPLSEKNLPYELTASFLLLATNPGVPIPIKCQAQHRSMFPLDAPISEESGKLILAWAKGGAKILPGAMNNDHSDSIVMDKTAYISGREAADLEARCSECGIPVKALLAAAKVESLARIKLPDLARAHGWIDKKVEAQQAQERA